MATHPNKKSDYKLIDFFKMFFQGTFEDLIVFLNDHGGINSVEEYKRTTFYQLRYPIRRKTRNRQR